MVPDITEKTGSSRINVNTRILPSIAVCVYSPCQPNRIAFDVAAGVGVVVAEIIVIQLGALVVELAWEAEVVAEGPRGSAVAEGVMVPLPLDAVAGVGDLVRRAEMIRCYIGGLSSR